MGASILVIDDDINLLAVLQNILEKWGYSVITASDPVEGIKLFYQNTPDMLMLDLMMPNLSGIDVLQRITKKDLEDIPVIVLTASSEDKERIESYEMGADDFIKKPFYFKELQIRIDNLLSRYNKYKRGQAKQTYEEKHLSGLIKNMSIATLLHGLEVDKKSGILKIEHKNTNEKACIFMANGQPYSARMIGRSQPRNEEVIYFVFTWKDGEFEFKECEINTEPEIDMDLTLILLEAARREDEKQKQ